MSEEHVETDGDRVDGIRHLRDMYVDNVWKSAALAAAAIGWIVTSDSARTFLRDEDVIRWLAVCLVAMFAVLQVAGLRSLAAAADVVAGGLGDANTVGQAFRISTPRLVGSASMTLAMFGLLAALIATL